MIKKLWHYTTLNRFKKILYSKCLHATSYKFLNDSSELIAAKNFLVAEVTDYLQKVNHKLFNKYKNELKQHICVALDTLYEASNTQTDGPIYSEEKDIFITSFSVHEDAHVKENGLPSQWHAYANEYGVSIVFNFDKLANLVTRENSKYQYEFSALEDVIYSDEDQKLRKFINGKIEWISDHILCRFEKYYLRNPKAYNPTEQEIQIMLNFFYEIISKYKDCRFKAESEVRIIKAPTTQECIDKFINPGESALPVKPIYELNRRYIKLFEDFNLTSAIDSIIVGPCIHQKNTLHELEKIFEDQKVKILTSRIPFRKNVGVV